MAEWGKIDRERVPADMFFFVLGFNLGLTLFNCWLVWKLCKLRNYLARVAITLDRIERRAHRILYPAPEYVLVGGAGTRCLGDSYRLLREQIRGLQPLLLTLSLLLRYWQRRSRRKRAEAKLIIRMKPALLRSLP